MPTAGQRVLAADFRSAVADSDDTTINNISSSTPTPGSPVVSVTFTAPTSGKALITVGGRMQDNGASSTMVFDYTVQEDDSGGSEILGTGSWDRRVELRGANSTATVNDSKSHVVTGLTAGQVYYVELQYYVTGGSTADVINRQLSVVPLPA
jgi:hypothetical protein